MQLAVIHPRVRRRRDHQRLRARRNLEVTRLNREVVVRILAFQSALARLDAQHIRIRVYRFCIIAPDYAQINPAQFRSDLTALVRFVVRFNRRVRKFRIARSVHLAVIRGRDRHRPLRDAQRSRHKSHTIILREVATLIQYIANNICLGAVSNVRDSAVCCHGDAEVVLLVTVNKALNSKLIASQRLAIVRLAIAASRNGQRNGIVDSDDIIRRIRNNRDALVRTVAIHGRIGIISVKCRSLTGRQRFADGLHASLIIRNLYLSALQIMMDGVIGLIQVEVQLEHRDSAARRIDSNGIRIHLILMLNQFILIILGLSLICISNRYSFTSFGFPGNRQFVILLILC